MSDLIGKVKVRLASGEIKEHKWSFRNKRDLDDWKKTMMGKKISAMDLTTAKMYGGYGKEHQATVIGVEEVKKKVQTNRGLFSSTQTNSNAQLKKMLKSMNSW